MDGELHCTKGWMCHTGHRTQALRGALLCQKLEWEREMKGEALVMKLSQWDEGGVPGQWILGLLTGEQTADKRVKGGVQ